MNQDPHNLERIEKLREKKARMRLGGGEKRLESQRSKGKLTVWERLEYFFDAGTFEEVGGFIDHRSTHFGLDKSRIAGDGVVTGFGLVNGSLVYIAAQDFTVLGGSLGEMHGRKIAHIMDMAITNGAPMVTLNDSGGARIQEGIGSLCGYGEIFFRNTRASGVIPQISVIMGPCAGGAVYSPGITDFVAMVANTSYMFITGPEVIKTVTGEEVTKDTLGGGDVHMEKSGVATHIGADDESTLDWVKILLSYLPRNNDSVPDRVPAKQPQLDVAELDHIVPSNPNKGYDIRAVIDRLVDSGTFFELQEGFAANINIGFARMDGITVGGGTTRGISPAASMSMPRTRPPASSASATRSTFRSSPSSMSPASSPAPIRNTVALSGTEQNCSTPTPRRPSRSLP